MVDNALHRKQRYLKDNMLIKKPSVLSTEIYPFSSVITPLNNWSREETLNRIKQRNLKERASRN